MSHVGLTTLIFCKMKSLYLLSYTCIQMCMCYFNNNNRYAPNILPRVSQWLSKPFRWHFYQLPPTTNSVCLFLLWQKPRQMTSITLQKALEEKLPRESLLLSCLSLKCFRASRYDLRKRFVLATSVIARFPDLT